MKKTALIIVGLMSMAGMTANAQKFVEGDESLSFLKGQKTLNLEYNYNDMLVGKKPEAEYKAEKVNAMNEKQRGKGDRWAEKWVNNRSAIFEPMCEELMNKVLSKEGTGLMAAKGQKDAKYTLELHTLMTEPGFNSVVMKVNPFCNYEIVWKETATGKVMAKAELDRVAGVNMGSSSYDFDVANSIKECYAKAGKVIGKTMVKALKK